MKKMIGIAVALAVVLALIRRFGPALRDRAMAMCREMFERSQEGSALDKKPENLVLATGG